MTELNAKNPSQDSNPGPGLVGYVPKAAGVPAAQTAVPCNVVEIYHIINLDTTL